MTPDLMEERLRSALHDATSAQDGVYLDLDPSVVLGRGRRAVLRRRMVAGAGIAAATVAVGLVGWSALGGGAERASLPAGTSQTTTDASGGAVTARLAPFSELADETGEAQAVPGPRQVAVTIDPRRTPDLVYSEVGSNGALTMMGGSSLQGISPTATTWGTAGEGSHVLVGVLPEQAVQFQLVTPTHDEGGHASTSVTEPLQGTGRQAFAVRFAEAGDAASVSHVLWWGEDGVVHDESGAAVPSVALGDPEGTVVFVSEAFDRIGTFSNGDGATMMELDGSRNSSGRPVLSAGRSDGGDVAWLFAAVVPAGAEPGTVTPGPKSTVTTPLTKARVAGTDLAVLWSRLSSPKDANDIGYASVTWTENGRTVTQRP